MAITNSQNVDNEMHPSSKDVILNMELESYLILFKRLVEHSLKIGNLDITDDNISKETSIANGWDSILFTFLSSRTCEVSHLLLW